MALSLPGMAAIAGCDQPPQRAAQTEPAPGTQTAVPARAAHAGAGGVNVHGPKTPTAVAQPLRPDDFAVFNAVLAHFATDQTIGSLRNYTTRQVVVLRRTGEGRWELSQVRGIGRDG